MNEIKEIRQHIDHLMIQSKQLTSNREMALAYTNMQRGSMWLGLVLQALGTANPYPESMNTENKKIEERTDQAKDSPAMFEGMPTDGDRTIAVKWFRKQLDGIISQVGDLFDEINNDEAMSSLQISYSALREAKMWFGWELNNIHTNQNG
jgi:hypothetical protein